MLDVKVKFNLPQSFEREVGRNAIADFEEGLIEARAEILKDFRKGPMDRDAAETLVQKAQASVLQVIDDNNGGLFFDHDDEGDSDLSPALRVEMKGDLAGHFFTNINS